MNKLNQFKSFQNGKGFIHDERAPSFREAIAEIRAGAKKGHWSWYIFPTDKPSRAFQSQFQLSRADAVLYLSDKTLRERYLTFMREVLAKKNVDPRTLLMSNVDVRKVYDSAAFFKSVASEIDDRETRDVTNKVMKQLQNHVNRPVPAPRMELAALFARFKS